jgi:signal transduction histidine kinase
MSTYTNLNPSDYLSSIDKAYKRQIFIYTLAFGILALVFIGAYIVQNRLFEKQENFAEIINLSEKQITLMHRIVALTLHYQDEIVTKYDSQENFRELEKAIREFEDLQTRFTLHLNDKDSLAGLNNDLTNKIYKENINNILLFIDESKLLYEFANIKNHEKNSVILNKHAQNIAHISLEKVLPSLEALSASRVAKAQEIHHFEEHYELVILIIFLSVLSIELLFIFIPNAKKRRINIIELFILSEKEKELEKFSALGEISAKIVHEINNPLSVVIGRLDIFLKNKNSKFDEKTLQTFENMKQNLWRISKIIRLTKIVYRKGNNDQVNLFDLKTMIIDIVETNQMLKQEEKIFFEYQLAENIKVQAQEHQVFQVINNIIGNAIDATQNLDPRIITINLTSDKLFAILQISDNGPGVPIGLEEKIFLKLFTTKKTGTGIGLFESQEILESYGGSLELLTQVSRSCFEIRIPLKM